MLVLCSKFELSHCVVVRHCLEEMRKESPVTNGDDHPQDAVRNSEKCVFSVGS